MEPGGKDEDKKDDSLPFETVEVPAEQTPQVGAGAPAGEAKPAPVMDVLPPQAAAASPARSTENDMHQPPPDTSKEPTVVEPAQAPKASADDPTNLDVDPAKAADLQPNKDKKDDSSAGEAIIPSKQPTPKASKQPKVKQPHQPGVGLAIFMAAVVVLALAAMATYAYLKTNAS